MTHEDIRRHPYQGLPDRQFWSQDPALADFTQFDPVSFVPFKISRSERIVTAGSCFAQHVGRHLSEVGYQHFIAEPAHPIVPSDIAARFNYGVYSCRYGNIYTARQLLQLLHRAYGVFVPIVESWPRGLRNNGRRVVDPFRPQIQPEGFVSAAELDADRASHFRSVRRAVEEMDIFVFTLGLTEAWLDNQDGAVYPLAPGVSGGVYLPDIVQFRNFDEVETTQDLLAALRFIRARNPRVKIILTVSPVPLNATYADRHVFASTTWSKGVLRIAAERVQKEMADCAYFPSYEIITAPHVRGRYFAQDCREVLPEGVQHVMRVFLKHFAGEERVKSDDDFMQPHQHADDDIRLRIAHVERLLDVVCDEQSITNRP
jgi:hypothetical protein